MLKKIIFKLGIFNFLLIISIISTIFSIAFTWYVVTYFQTQGINLNLKISLYIATIVPLIVAPTTGWYGISLLFKIEALKNSLDLKVKEKTEELSSKNKQLEELNNSLNLKVKSEVNKQLEQKKILIQQSIYVAKSEMIEMIGHQWRQPLNSLSLIIQNLKLQQEFDTLTKENINDSVDKSNQLIQLMSSNIDSFKILSTTSSKVETYDLYDTINNILHLMSYTFSENHIKIDFEHSSLKIPHLKNELSQVIVYVLKNSKDAFDKHKIKNPLINIKLVENESHVDIIISDNALGIDEIILSKVFEPYFTTKENLNGTGLGLYLSKLIVENQLKSTINIKNIDNGLEVKISLRVNSY